MYPRIQQLGQAAALARGSVSGPQREPVSASMCSVAVDTAIEELKRSGVEPGGRDVGGNRTC